MATNLKYRLHILISLSLFFFTNNTNNFRTKEKTKRSQTKETMFFFFHWTFFKVKSDRAADFVYTCCDHFGLCGLCLFVFFPLTSSSYWESSKHSFLSWFNYCVCGWHGFICTKFMVTFNQKRYNLLSNDVIIRLKANQFFIHQMGITHFNHSNWPNQSLIASV